MIDSGSMEGGAARSPVFRFAWVGRAALAATILPELTAAADVALDVVGTALVGLTAVVVRLGLVAARELEVAREELARLAIAEERLRFAGDLNRLLGDRLDLLAVTIDELAADGSADGIESRRARTRRLAGDAPATLRAVRSAVDSFRRPPAASRG